LWLRGGAREGVGGTSLEVEKRREVVEFIPVLQLLTEDAQ